MKTITIITPTYNRATLLKCLYNSLKNQTNYDFEWLVVDDGSTDDTQAVIQGFKKENLIEIRSIRQDNGGKHRALNRGIAEIRTELTFIVDSDDSLPVDAVDIILRYHNKYYEKKAELCGYSFLRRYKDGSVNAAYFKKDEEIATFCEIRINGNIGGDKAEVFYTEILKKYPFPEYEGENFLPEDLVWMRMSDSYQMVHINQCIYISEYLEGGLTRTGRAMKIYSPRGMMSRSEVYLQNDNVNLKTKIKMMILYIIYGRFAGINTRELFRRVSKRGLFLIVVVPSNIIYHKWKWEYKR